MKYIFLILTITVFTGCTWVDQLKADIMLSSKNVQEEAEKVITDFKETKETVENTVEEVKSAAESIKKASDAISEITK